MFLTRPGFVKGAAVVKEITTSRSKRDYYESVVVKLQNDAIDCVLLLENVYRVPQVEGAAVVKAQNDTSAAGCQHLW